MGTAAGHSVVKHGSNRPSRSGRLSIAVVGFVLVVGLVWFLPAREWTIALVQRIRGAGATGVLIFIAAYMAAAVALAPGSLLTMAAGFAYGPIG
jgi:uncharacterized membrane protein YdjX (TVP38/TMEM64 family)